MEENMKIIFNGKKIKDLRNENVYVELDDSVERTHIDITEIQNIDITEMQKLPRDSISGTIYIKKSTENDRDMQEFLEDCKAKVLLETWRKLKDSNNK